MNGPFIWYKNFGRSFFRFITIHAFDRRTDRRTDILLIAKTSLHKCSTAKNLNPKRASVKVLVNEERQQSGNL